MSKAPDHPRDHGQRLSLERLRALVAELRAAGAVPAVVAPRNGPNHHPLSLAFLFSRFDPEDVRLIMDQIDVTLPLSDDAAQTLAALKELIEENRKLKDQVVTDPLTDLYNIRHFHQQIQIEMERVRRTEKPCALLMIDLDRFKPVNDAYGHQTGDRVLQDVADIIRENIRAVDVPVRYGGDEFAVILPGAGSQDAATLAERLRIAMETDPRTATYGVTGSFGLSAHHSFDVETAKDLIERADQAVYRVKAKGGNQVVFYEADRRKEAITEVSTAERDALDFTSLIPEDEE